MTQQTPQPPQREPSDADGADGYEPIPLWLFTFFGALIFWGGWYLAMYSGGFRSDIFDEQPEARFQALATRPLEPADPMVIGKRLFQANCVTCHQGQGQGQSGQYPPLAGSEWVLGDPARIIRIVLQGLDGRVTVKGQTYNGSMPTFAAKLKDEHLAGVLTYIRSSWGNNAAAISPAAVADTRKATGQRATPWAAAELLAITTPDFQEP